MLSNANIEFWNSAEIQHANNLSEKRSRTKWECKITDTLIGDFIITPLTSAKKLHHEDEWMKNGCQKHAFQCSAGIYSLFSIQSKTGDQRATLGLINSEDHWSLDYCIGPHGKNVMDEILEYFDDDGILQTEWLPTEIYFVAHEVARLMNSATFHS